MPTVTETNWSLPCERRHPQYEDKICHWAFLLSTYESSRCWFKDNIFKFNREGPETYTGRLERAYRFNHTREVVDLVNKYLFKEAPVRSEDVPDYIQRFRKRATLSGLAIDEFERQCSRYSSIFGRIYVVVDSTTLDEEQVGEVVSVADEKRAEKKLYAYVVQPQDMLDCAYDDFGQFKWMMIREFIRDDEDPLRASGACEEKFRLWTKTEWFLFAPKKKKDKITYYLEEHGVHDLGMVPVVKCDHIESDNQYSVPALIEDIAYLDRAIANYLSNLDQIINDQTFSQLVIPWQGMMGPPGAKAASSGLSTDESDPDVKAAKQRMVKMGTSQVLPYDAEGGTAPSYIAPDPRQATLIISTVKQVINEIYHTVGLAGERTKQDNSLGIDNSSGVAKAYDFEKVNGLLSAKANAMQNFSNRLEQLVAAWNGEPPTLDKPLKASVLYSTNFDVRGLADDMTIASQMGLIGIPMEIRRKHLTGIVEKLWPLMKTEEKQKLLGAIAKWEDDTYASTVPPPRTPEDKSAVTAPKDKGKPGNPKG